MASYYNDSCYYKSALTGIAISYDQYLYEQQEKEYRRRKEEERRRKERYCISCGLEHGPSEMFEGGKCELTMVKEWEDREKKDKRHADNIRKLYWERFIQRGLRIL